MGDPFGRLSEVSVDEAVASAFGRKPQVQAEGKWRTGPPGQLTDAEITETIGSAFGYAHTPELRQKQARAAEIRRQIAMEQATLKLASEKGWDWLKANTDGKEAIVVESVRARLGGGSSSELRESAGAALLDAGLRVQVRESNAVAPTKLTARRLQVTIMTPGQGSSGWYPAETLEAAARDKVFAKGLHLYLDHPTAREVHDRPERSVRDLAAVLATDARWTGSALVAEADVLPAHAELIASLEGVAGMSIRAQGDVEMSDVGGQRVRKITRLLAAESVDFVTRAGRGGTYQVIESERPRWGW